MIRYINLFFLLTVFFNSSLVAQLPTSLFQKDNLEYSGAFRIPAGTVGVSSMNFSEGPFVYNPLNHSIFIVGHDHQQAIAEYSIPALDTGQIQDLNMAVNLQPFSQHLNIPTCGNTQNINQIGGMALIDGKLFINAYEYYDADGNVTHTTIILDDPADLANTGVDGYYAFDGGAGHTAGWMSEIPDVWKDTLHGSYITGASSGIPIISRCSVGPSAFSWSPESLVTDCSVNAISTTTLLDFSLANPLHDDLSNTSLLNDLWTHLSRATFGMIVPDSRTYLTIGYSGGHASGVCYKCTQDDGNVCGGYCPPIAADYDQYYWLWDMDDLLAVKAGFMAPYEVRPYDYGTLHTPFENSTKQIGGGSFDAATKTLYLSIQRADRDQGTYANPPVIVAYKLNGPDPCASVDSSILIETEDIYDNMDVYAQDYIQSNAVISNFNSVFWSTSGWIELLPQFELEEGSTMTLTIGDCALRQ